VTARARAFGIYTETIDGQDVQLVNESMQRLVERARRGEGPAFLECMTYRYYGHHVGDINRTYYRSKEEEQEWRSKHDPLQLLADRLISRGLTDRKVLDQIYSDVKSEVERGVKFAIDAPFPNQIEVDQDVYA
jgi:pyruvate dehydrogenase E1 component alpha subunit